MASVTSMRMRILLLVGLSPLAFCVAMIYFAELFDCRKYVTKWEDLSPFLGLTQYSDQKRQDIRKWREKVTQPLTYRALVTAAKVKHAWSWWTK